MWGLNYMFYFGWGQRTLNQASVRHFHASVRMRLTSPLAQHTGSVTIRHALGRPFLRGRFLAELRDV